MRHQGFSLLLVVVWVDLSLERGLINNIPNFHARFTEADSDNSEHPQHLHAKFEAQQLLCSYELVHQCLSTTVDTHWGVPRYIRASLPSAHKLRREFISESIDGSNTAETAALKYLRHLSSLYKLDPVELSGAKVTQIHDNHSNLNIVKIHQFVNDVQVFGQEMTVGLSKHAQLLSISGYLAPHTHVHPILSQLHSNPKFQQLNTSNHPTPTTHNLRSQLHDDGQDSHQLPHNEAQDSHQTNPHPQHSHDDGKDHHHTTQTPHDDGQDPHSTAINTPDQTTMTTTIHTTWHHLVHLLEVDCSLVLGDATTPQTTSHQYHLFKAAALTGMNCPLVLSHPIRAKRVWFPLHTQLVDAYYVEFIGRHVLYKVPFGYSIVAHIQTGNVLYRADLTSNAKYKVFADISGRPLVSPTYSYPIPTSFLSDPTAHKADFPPKSQRLVDVNYTTWLPTTDVWLPLHAMDLTGNNVEAYGDILPPSGRGTGDVTVKATSPNTFDYEWNSNGTLAASTHQQAALVQLFYDVNWLHDFWYSVGFDEKAGNAQTDNFNRGGHGNDAVLAEAQDFSSTNNAHMLTPPDGTPPVMQMYWFNAHQLTCSLSDPTTGAPAPLHSTVNPGNTPGIFQTEAGYLPPSWSTAAGNVIQYRSANGDTDACTTMDPTVQAGNKVVLISSSECRGKYCCSLSTRLSNAQSAGAIMAIFAGDVAHAEIPLGTTNSVNIPAVFLQSHDNLIGKQLQCNRVIPFNPEDGALAWDVVAHEFGHLVSARLVADGLGLMSTQALGLSEGWSDIMALLVVLDNEDIEVEGNSNWGGAYPIASYPLDKLTGIRRFPYSTNLQINGLMFKHIAVGATLPNGESVGQMPSSSDTRTAQVHNTGEIWGSMLWDCLVEVLKENKGANNVPDVDKTRREFGQLLVQSLKLTPPYPTFVDARNAFLTALQANLPRLYTRCSSAFSRRGLGRDAKAPPIQSHSLTELEESFTEFGDDPIPVLFLDTFASNQQILNDDDFDTIWDVGEILRFRLTVKHKCVNAIKITPVKIESTKRTFEPRAEFSPPVIEADGLACGAHIVETVFEINATLTATPPASMVMVQFRLAAADATRVSDYISATIVTAPLANADVCRWRTRTESDPDAYKANFVEWKNTVIPGFQRAIVDTWRVTGPAQYTIMDIEGNIDSSLHSPFWEVTGTFSLAFVLQFVTENEADGLVIEAQIQGAPNWTDLGLYMSPQYNSRIRAEANSVIAGRSAFSGTLSRTGYKINLSNTWNGKTVRIRFRFVRDDTFPKDTTLNIIHSNMTISGITIEGTKQAPFPVIADDGTCVGRPPSFGIRQPKLYISRSSVSVGRVRTFDQIFDPKNSNLPLWRTVPIKMRLTVKDDTKSILASPPEIDTSGTISYVLTGNEGTAVIDVSVSDVFTSTQQFSIIVIEGEVPPPSSPFVPATPTPPTPVRLITTLVEEDDGASISTVGIVLICIAAVVVLLALAFVVHAWWRKRTQRNRDYAYYNKHSPPPMGPVVTPMGTPGLQTSNNSTTYTSGWDNTSPTFGSYGSQQGYGSHYYSPTQEYGYEYSSSAYLNPQQPFTSSPPRNTTPAPGFQPNYY